MIKKLLVIIPCLILLNIGLWADSSNIEVCDIENNIISAQEIAMDQDGKYILTTLSTTRTLSPKNIMEINFSSPIIKKHDLWEITLSNKDIFYGKIKEPLKEETIKIESPLLGTMDLNIKDLLTIKSPQLKSPTNLTFKKDEDAVQFLNGDSDQGIITNFNDKTIKLSSSIYKKERTYGLKDIALVFFSQITPPPKEPDKTTSVIIASEGSRITGQIQNIKKGYITSKSLYGLKHKLPLNKISLIYFKNPDSVYLSDIEPVTVKEYPTIYDPKHIIFPWKYQKDRNVMKTGLISIKGKKFYKGLGVHANCELTYDIAGQYNKFIATVALDDVSGTKGSVQFIVYLDGKKAYESKIIKWQDNPEIINLRVKKVKELKLVVTNGPDLHILDRAAWANARLIK